MQTYGSIEPAIGMPVVSVSWKFAVPGVPENLRRKVVALFNVAFVPSSRFEALKVP